MSLLDTVTDNTLAIADKAFGESNLLTGLLDNTSNKFFESMKALPGARELQELGFPSVDLMQSDAQQGPVVRDHRQDQYSNGNYDQYNGSYDQGNVRDEWNDYDSSRPVVRDHRHGSHHHHDHDGPIVRDHRHDSYDHESRYDRPVIRDHRHEAYCDNGYGQWDLNDYLAEIFGDRRSPLQDLLGGQTGFDRSMRFAMDLLSGHPENLLKDLLGLAGGDRSSGGGGGGGLFGKLFSGISGLLGGGDKGGGLLGGVLGGLLGGGESGGILGGIPGGGSGGGGLLDSLLPVALKVAPLLL